MRISLAHNRRKKACSGSSLTEACIGLSLMTFTWILMSYSLFMADNQIRTVMAARFAAWFRGASNSQATAEQLNKLFFYTPVASVAYKPGQGIADLLSASNNNITSEASKFSNTGDGPYLATVTFGVKDVNAANTPFPFDLMRTKVPLMPDSMMNKALEVSSSCQWDGVGETWRTPGKALEGAFNMLKGIVTKFF